MLQMEAAPSPSLSKGLTFACFYCVFCVVLLCGGGRQFPRRCRLDLAGPPGLAPDSAAVKEPVAENQIASFMTLTGFAGTKETKILK